MVKALGFGQEWRHPEAEAHHALFMLDLTDVETPVSKREDNSPCVKRAEFFVWP